MSKPCVVGTATLSPGPTKHNGVLWWPLSQKHPTRALLEPQTHGQMARIPLRSAWNMWKPSGTKTQPLGSASQALTWAQNRVGSAHLTLRRQLGLAGHQVPCNGQTGLRYQVVGGGQICVHRCPVTEQVSQGDREGREERIKW